MYLSFLMNKITKLPKKWTIKWNDGDIWNFYLINNKVYYDYYNKTLDKWAYNQRSTWSIEKWIDKFNNDKLLAEQYKLGIIRGLKEEEFEEIIKGL